MKLQMIATAALGLVVGFVLSGCNQTVAQATFANQNAQASKAVADFKACRLQIRQDERFVSILKYLTDFETGQFTIEQLSNSNIPTAEEARLYAKFYDENLPCNAAFVQQISAARPDTTTIFVESQEQGKKIALDIVTRKISWGEFSKRASENNTSVKKALADADTQNRQQLQAENSEELAHRRQAAIAYLHAMQNQQLINAINRPTVTNCNAYGNSVNCISQ